jgi:diguanylate cyclase (GGDEF)-like protein
MNIDDILRRAAQEPAVQLSEVEIRRNMRLFELDRRKSLTPGHDPTAGLDLGDPLELADDEALRIAQQAELLGLGTFTWRPAEDMFAWSGRMASMLDYLPEAKPARRLYLDRVHKDDRKTVEDHLNQASDDHEPLAFEHRTVRANGEVRHLECVLQVLLDPHGTPTGLLGTARDITESVMDKRALARLSKRLETVMAVVGESLADRDPHTRLFNRRRFVAELDREIRTGEGTVLLLGLEGLREVNRQNGPQAGDDVVAAVAKLLANVVRPTDVLARIGGNEFAVLLPRTIAPGARPIAERIAQAMRTPFLAAGQSPVVTRIGMVHFSGGQPAAGEDLLIDADQALYDAKERSTEIVEGLPPGSVSAAERRRRWRKRVRIAIRGDLLDLHAQPIVDLSRNVVTRHELLLRLSEWNDPITPSSFLSTAERLGTIVQIDQYVIRKAIELLVNDPCGRHVQVNLSGRSVCEEGLPELVADLLSSHGVKPSRLTFEITETALISNMTAARQFADRLHEMGCQLALDDFGSGYASLAHLKYLPFDMVKIDGEFVAGLLENKSDQIMVKSIAQMCAGLGVQTVAEFVENTETKAVLVDYGVDMAQGFAVGRPIPISEIPNSLEQLPDIIRTASVS